MLQFEQLGKYSKIAYIEAFGNLESELPLNLLHRLLTSEEKLFVDASIVAISKIGSRSSISYLEKLTHANNCESIIYAEEAINIITNKLDE